MPVLGPGRLGEYSSAKLLFFLSVASAMCLSPVRLAWFGTLSAGREIRRHSITGARGGTTRGKYLCLTSAWLAGLCHKPLILRDSIFDPQHRRKPHIATGLKLR